jgi:hypothetical protein
MVILDGERRKLSEPNALSPNADIVYFCWH